MWTFGLKGFIILLFPSLNGCEVSLLGLVKERPLSVPCQVMPMLFFFCMCVCVFVLFQSVL